ncbi:hypothetical protein HMPREF2946_05110 [Actinomyces sp. HMSC062G12]|nr:hypothetical protein HMPREF2946_05110 [Actinomyces sp. HMSC062G12]
MQFTGRSVLDWVLTVVGVAFTILLVSNMTAIFAKKDWGQMLVFCGAAVLCGWVILSPDTFITFIKFVAQKIIEN